MQRLGQYLRAVIDQGLWVLEKTKGYRKFALTVMCLWILYRLALVPGKLDSSDIVYALLGVLAIGAGANVMEHIATRNKPGA